MRYCKAWPDACITNSKSEITDDAIVLPKSVVDTAVDRVVEQTVNELLKSTTKHETADEDPKPVVVKKKFKKSISYHEPKEISPSKTSDMTFVWICFGIFAFVGLIAFQSLTSRIENMESWLHGRLASGP